MDSGMYVYVCICMYVCTYVCMYASMNFSINHSCIHTYLHTYTYTYMHACIRTCTHKPKSCHTTPSPHPYTLRAVGKWATVFAYASNLSGTPVCVCVCEKECVLCLSLCVLYVQSLSGIPVCMCVCARAYLIENTHTHAHKHFFRVFYTEHILI